MTHSYADIIQHPHHVSAEHPHMSMHDRAAQFSPFAALVGYEEATKQAARLNEERQSKDTLQDVMEIPDSPEED